MKAKIKSLFLTGFPVALTALLLAVVFAWAWVEPTQGPPNGNVPAPINVGPTGQAKRGNLMLNTDGSLEYGLLIPYGKVGIGTITPATRLEVKATTDEILRLTRDGATYPVNFKVGTDGALVINANNTDVLTLKDGNVGIGMTNPRAALDVVGSLMTEELNVYNPCSCEGTGYEIKTINGVLVYVDCNADKCWTPTPNSTYNWYSARDYCNNLVYAGFTDWVLPDKTTLLNLCNSDSCTGIGPCFDGEGEDAYWSNTSVSVEPEDAYYVYFKFGCEVSTAQKISNYMYVRCVREASGNVGIGTITPAAKLDVAGDVKIRNDLEVSGTIKRNGNLVWDAGNDGPGSGLDADTVDGYEAADLLAGGGSGCSDNPPHDCYIGIDLDGDGYTTVEGDCDERCESCYSGSTEYTSSPDGKDQDCDGNIDEIDVVKIKQCGDSSTWRPVSKPDVISACESYCSSKGLAYAQIGCGDEFQPNADEVAHELDFSDCSRGDINYDFWQDPPACGRWQACYCKVYR